MGVGPHEHEVMRSPRGRRGGVGRSPNLKKIISAAKVERGEATSESG